MCVGDCDDNGTVAINELIVGVNIALGTQPVSACEAFDCQGNDTVPINCLIQGVNSALNGCPAESTITITGSCAVPGTQGVSPCEVGTPIALFRCDDRSQCLHQQELTMVGATTVAAAGGWSVQIPTAEASATLIVRAGIAEGVAYRTLAFASAGALLRAGVTQGGAFAPAPITPVTEAAVELLDANGFENYSDSAAQEVVSAVEQATAELTFAGLTPEAAAVLALNTASADPMVMMVLHTARNTPTHTSSPRDPPTQTATATPTPTTASPATPTETATPGRYVDNGDGTVTDTATGLVWEKKDRGGGLHDVTASHRWAGLCNDGSGLCQPDAAAAATCAAATGGAEGCAMCAGTATCFPGMYTTIWGWLNQLNAARFAGHDDWRIPTVAQDGGTAELETLLDTSVPGCAVGSTGFCIDPAFRATCLPLCTVTTCSCAQNSAYWSATDHPDDPGTAWVVSFVNGGGVRFVAQQNGIYVRAVRGGS